METKIIVRETWLSKMRYARALDVSLLLLSVVILASFVFLNGILGAENWMPASREAVFQRHEWWRTFTTLFAHADLGHLLGNCILLFPFSFFLTRHFPQWFFPMGGLLAGAITNLLVLLTLPPKAELIGISGVVYWMGAAWLTLYMLIEKREPAKRRWGKFIIITVALFIPDTVRPEVSYLSHYIGFGLGVLAGYGLFLVMKSKILRAEIRELVLLSSPIEEEEWKLETPVEIK